MLLLDSRIHSGGVLLGINDQLLLLSQICAVWARSTRLLRPIIVLLLLLSLSHLLLQLLLLDLLEMASLLIRCLRLLYLLLFRVLLLAD